MQLDVVVPMNERERVPVRYEARERVEHVAVALDDQAQFDANVVDAVAETVLMLLFAALRRQRNPSWLHRHSYEIDEIASEDKTPAIGGKRGCAIIFEQLDEVFVDVAGSPNRPADVVQVAPEVDVGQNEQALHARSKRKTRTRLRA
jgi:hypothetical protein